MRTNLGTSTKELRNILLNYGHTEKSRNVFHINVSLRQTFKMSHTQMNRLGKLQLKTRVKLQIRSIQGFSTDYYLIICDY